MTSLGLEWEICTYLSGASIGVTFGTNLFATLLPDQPDLCASIQTRGGMRPVMTLTGAGKPGTGTLPESKFDRPNIQLRARAGMQSYAAGNDMVQAIFGALQGITETTLRVGGPLFHLVSAIQSPQYLGRDEKQRHQWSQNFRVWWSNPQR